jgi:hypothetical protein
MGEKRHSSTILDLVTRWMWVVSFTPPSLYSRGKILRYGLVGGLVGPGDSLDPEEMRKDTCTFRESNSSPPACSKSLYHLSYPSSGYTNAYANYEPSINFQIVGGGYFSYAVAAFLTCGVQSKFELQQVNSRIYFHTYNRIRIESGFYTCIYWGFLTTAS